MREEILLTLNEIFRNYFDDTDLTIKYSTSAPDIEEWDSLAQVGLIISIEKQYGIAFTASEVDVLRNIGDMVELIHEKLK